MKTTLRARLVQAWIGWALGRSWLVLCLAFGLAIAAVVYTALQLDFQTRQLDLISSHNPLVQLSKRVKPFEGKDAFTVIIEAPTPLRAIAFLQELTRRLQADSKHFQDVLYRIDPALIQPWALLYLEEKDLQRLQERLAEYPALLQGLAQQPDLLTFLQLVNKEMATRMVGELFTGFLQDTRMPGETKSAPMDIGFLIQTLADIQSSLRGPVVYHSPWAQFFSAGGLERELEGYFWAAEKRYLLLLVTPVKDKQTFNRTRAALERLRTVIQEARAAFPEVQVGVTGQEALRTDEMTIALQDMSWATWISMAGVWLLIFLFFRSGGRTFIRIIALLVGMCWTFGWATLFIGHLNILSVVFAPMLIGIGDDYIAHWFARLEEEEQQPGISPREAILRVGAGAGPGILTAGASAALSFLPFVLTGFKGLVELGLITGVGILLNVAADLIVLPLLSLYSRKPTRLSPPSEAPETANLLRFSRRQAFWVLLGAAVLSVYGGWYGLRVGFDLNPLHLQAAGSESVEWEERLRQHANRSVIHASTLALSADEVFRKTAAFQALPSVWKVQSVFSLLPEQQEDKLPRLHAMLADFPTVRPLAEPGHPPDLNAFRDILGRIRFKMDDAQAEQWGARRPVIEQLASVRELTGDILTILQQDPARSTPALAAYQQRFHQDLRETLELMAQGRQASLMRLDDLPAMLRERFFLNNQYMIRIYPRYDIWEWEPRDRFVSDLRSVDAQVVGDVITLHDFTDAFQQASIEAAIYALLAIFLLLILTFRDWRLSLLALVPLLVGTLLTFGVMGLAEIRFNPANMVFLPIIVGVGVEYGIVLLHRWQEGRMLPGHLPLSTGKGVILAALTTTIGFGSLIICRHQGIFSLGFLSFVGSLFVLAAAVLLIPAILAGMQPPPYEAEKEEQPCNDFGS